MPYNSASASASLSSFFGMASKAYADEVTSHLRLQSSQPSDSGDLLTEWTWTGLLTSSRLLRGLSWGVSCLRTDCRENQDGWAVQVYACTLAPDSPTSCTSRVASEPAVESDRVAALGPVPTAPAERSPPAQFQPTFSFSWNHELTSMNSHLSGLLRTSSFAEPARRLENIPSRTAEPPRTESLSNRTDNTAGSGHSASGHSHSVNPDETENVPPPMLEEARSRETFIGSATFVVLDGHGAGGRDAAAAIEKSFDSVFSRILTAGGDLISPMSLLESVAESLQTGQRMIEKLNSETQRDFGTTCVSVTLVNDILISTSCGDSTALLFAFPPGNWSSTRRPLPLVVELSRRHNLEDRDELKRIADEGRGRVIRGDGGVLRLIPGDIEYEEAKRRGLSINMGRSLGHAIFKDCGLSTQVDFSFLALKQIPKLLGMQPRRTTLTSRCFRLPPLSLDECRKLIDQFGTKKRPDESNKSKTNALLRCFTRKPSATPDQPPPAATQIEESPAPRIGDIFVLLMSDGVTDVLSSTCIVDMLKEFDQKWRAKKRAFDPSAFALTLTQVARERRIKACQRADNCTCLAVHLISK